MTMMMLLLRILPLLSLLRPVVAQEQNVTLPSQCSCGFRDPGTDRLFTESIIIYFNETDPADLHYRLAKALRHANKLPEAKREVLKALEEAPRFREAHQLLLDVAEHDQESQR